jgi:hypothetical protein
MAKPTFSTYRPHTKSSRSSSGRTHVPASFGAAIRKGWRLDGGLGTRERFEPADNESQEFGFVELQPPDTSEDRPTDFYIEVPYVARYRYGKPRLKSTRERDQ